MVGGSASRYGYLRGIVSMGRGRRVDSVQGLQADPTEGYRACPYALGSFRDGCQPSGPVASFSDQGYSGCSIPWKESMSERRFVLADFTHISTTECLRIYEAGNMYTLPRAVAHAAAKRELVATATLPRYRSSRSCGNAITKAS
jgi:hypothetical protein